MDLFFENFVGLDFWKSWKGANLEKLTKVICGVEI